MDTPATIDQAAVDDDIAFILEAAKKSYSGSRFLPGGEFEALAKSLQEIRGPLERQSFCEQIAGSLKTVSDAHLSAKIIDDDFTLKGCGRGHDSRSVPTVGTNMNLNGKLPWKTELVEENGRAILQIAITIFPSHTSKVWDGFLSGVEELHQKADAVVIDMRGNGGGDDTMGAKLAETLSGGAFLTPYSEQCMMATPEAFQLMLNAITMHSDMAKHKGLTPPFPEAVAEAIRGQRDATTSNDRAVPCTALPLPEQPVTELLKPTYILMDSSCVSSCESTIDFFEGFSNVVRVGTRTAGKVHFGNVGVLATPNAKILIHMPTTFLKYKDGRFIERKGIAPHLNVERGQDAMDVASQAATKR